MLSASPRSYLGYYDEQIKQKITEIVGVILLSEYHAGSIRLWRVILLRSDIRLAPSGIRFASFRANRIPLKPQGFNITIASAIISLRRSRNITLVFSADLCYNEANEKPSSERKVARRSRDGRSLRDFRFVLASW